MPFRPGRGMTEFETFWADSFGEIPPLGYLLTAHFSDARWVRFHALPDSKRYAGNDTERAIVLARANELAGWVLGVGTPCWMIANSHPHQEEIRARLRPDQRFVREIFGLPESHAWVDENEDPDERTVWTTYAGECAWQPGAFDEAIGLVADDVESGVLWVSKNTKAVFAPYDGGFDLIVNSAREVQELNEKFTDWLSPRSDGL